MTTRDTAFAAGTPCWVELLTSDPEGAAAFYGQVLGWTARPPAPEHGGYVDFVLGDRPVAGMVTNTGESGAPDGWSTYLATPDAAATVAAAQRAGATVAVPAVTVGTLGAMAVLTDPSGAAVGLWQAAELPGFTRYNEPGSVVWDELHTRDFDAATAFYRDVLGWGLQPLSDSAEFRYSQGQVDGRTVAGVLDLTRSPSTAGLSRWVVYFAVADVDAAAETAVGAGGRILQPPRDTPFGRITEIEDATGATAMLSVPTADGGE
ncbi:VOC family protein [Nakamurella endophytica]|uniref:Glyoxalase/bleomycin resistance protein n=1 Tax=Nakamurella endophytica TaxID=1748367 RepID=A0A917SZY9_9ACTN|nr:VOC family protein [Nakamurella endophytica]GGM05534.1 putative glyoxalase/bleomycin resistance protein [Nakamurella endophytica]